MSTVKVSMRGAEAKALHYEITDVSDHRVEAADTLDHQTNAVTVPIGLRV